MTVIKVEKLSKKIKDKEILRNISFEINDGECVALIGPNGAGKTTLIDCLLGDKFVSSGQIAIQGFAPTDPRLKQLISILPQENTVVQDLKVKELLSFFQSIYPNSLSNQEIDDLLRFSDKQKNQLAGKLFWWAKTFVLFRVGFNRSSENSILDEPTAAMDTSTRQHFWEIVNQLKKNGVTIVYSSHYIEEVEHTADRILVLHKGELIRDTTPYAMRGEEQEKHFTVPLTYQEVIRTLDQVQELEIKQNALSFTTKEASQVWEALQEQGCTIEEIEVRNRTLLDSIFETTQD